MQSDRHRVLAGGLQRTGRHAHLCLFDGETLLGQGFGDVEVGHGTEQTAVDAGFLGDGDGHAVQLVALALSGSQFLGSCFFQFGALDFELGHGSLRCAAGHFLRDQEVTCVTVLDLDDVAQVADVDDFFQQDNLHFILQ